MYVNRSLLQEQTVTKQVNKITSVKAAVPYRYHDLPVCTPDRVTVEYESLGTVFAGNRLEQSVMKVPRVQLELSLSL